MVTFNIMITKVPSYSVIKLPLIHLLVHHENYIFNMFYINTKRCFIQLYLNTKIFFLINKKTQNFEKLSHTKRFSY